MENKKITSTQLYNDIIKIINSVDMCDKHRDQLIAKFKLYFANKNELFQIINDEVTENSTGCGGNSCKCKE